MCAITRLDFQYTHLLFIRDPACSVVGWFYIRGPGHISKYIVPQSPVPLISVSTMILDSGIVPEYPGKVGLNIIHVCLSTVHSAWNRSSAHPRRWAVTKGIPQRLLSLQILLIQQHRPISSFDQQGVFGGRKSSKGLLLVSHRE